MPSAPQKKKEPGKLFVKHIAAKVFLEDWALKLTALIITLGLWFGVTGLSTPTTKRISVPLNLSIASSAQVMNVPQQEVDIEISGDKRKMDQINRADLSATLDLTDVAPGDRVVSLGPGNVYVPLPQGVKLVDVAPGRIAVNLEAVEERDVEVRIESEGAPAPGYEIYTSLSLPPKIRVRGPSSVVSQLTSVETDKIDVTGRREEFTAKQVAVSASNPKVAVLSTVVDVYFRIGEKRGERAFSAPVTGLPGKVATFVLYGPRALLKVKPDDLKAEIYLNENGEEVPRVVLPPDLQGLVEIRKLAVK